MQHTDLQIIYFKGVEWTTDTNTHTHTQSPYSYILNVLFITYFFIIIIIIIIIYNMQMCTFSSTQKQIYQHHSFKM